MKEIVVQILVGDCYILIHDIHDFCPHFGEESEKWGRIGGDENGKGKWVLAFRHLWEVIAGSTRKG